MEIAAKIVQNICQFKKPKQLCLVTSGDTEISYQNVVLLMLANFFVFVKDNIESSQFPMM